MCTGSGEEEEGHRRAWGGGGGVVEEREWRGRVKGVGHSAARRVEEEASS